MKTRNASGASGGTRARSPRTAALGAAAAVLTATTLVGCGTSDTPAQAVPAIGTSLDDVDSAISAGHLAQARSELKTLIATTTRARNNSKLSDHDATQILNAAQALLVKLPTNTPAPSSTASPGPTATPTKEPEKPKKPSEGEGGGEHGDHGEHGKHGGGRGKD